MPSAPGVTMELNWGSSGSALRTMSIPISRKVHTTPPFSPDHCHDRPKQLQSLVSMCTQGVFNARIIGELRHKSPAGAAAVYGVSAHPGLPRARIVCSAPCGCTLREPSPRNPRVLRDGVHPQYLQLLQCVLSIHSSKWHVSKLSVRPITPKRHKTLLKFTHGRVVCGIMARLWRECGSSLQ